jgi:hypothetical protein
MLLHRPLREREDSYSGGFGVGNSMGDAKSNGNGINTVYNMKENESTIDGKLYAQSL